MERLPYEDHPAVETPPAEVSGGPAARPFRGVGTLPGVLHRTADGAGPRDLVFLHDDGRETAWSYAELLVEARRILAGLRAAGLGPGAPAILQLEQHEDVLAAFWGCVLGGIVPVVAAVPPSYVQANRPLEQLRHVWEVLGRPAVVNTARRRDKLLDGVAWLGESPPGVAAIEDLRQHDPDVEPRACRPDDPLFFTLTSGSTSAPKCVALTHRNILSRALGTNQLCGHTPDDVALSWLPLDHIGSMSDWHLRCVVLGCRAVYAPAEHVLARPLRWLELIDRYRVTHTWAPNFAYGLVREALEAGPPPRWDLSCVEAFLTAGESVSPGVMERFLELLAPCGLKPSAVRPAFGMAEMGSGVTYHCPAEGTTFASFRARRGSLSGHMEPAGPDEPDAVRFACLGPPIPGVAIRIVDGEGNVLPEETVGGLHVRGEPVAAGYYGAQQKDGDPFRADGWFDTGDLGFISHGELYVTGRAKQSIILSGSNYYCGEIEEVAETVEGVEPSFSAACAVRGPDGDTEQLAIFFHAAVSDEQELLRISRDIRRRVSRRIGVTPRYVLPVSKEAIPKTAIGKLQRSRLSAAFEAGEFDATLERLDRLGQRRRPIDAGAAPRNETERRVAEIWKDVLGLSEVGIRENLFELGGNSLLLVRLHARLEAAFGSRLSVVEMFQHPTVEAQARVLTEDAGGQAGNDVSRRGLKRAEARKGLRSPGRSQDVAVIGLACRFPGAANPAEFWRNLRERVESISFFSEEEVIASGVDPDTARRPEYVRAGPILDGVEWFDAELFGYTAREAELMDPQQRVLLECAWEALEDAGYEPRNCPGSVGVYAGAVLNTYLLNHLYPSGLHRDGRASDLFSLSSTAGFQVMVASDKDYLPTRISYKLNLRGPSVNVQTACSSSLVAIHAAAQALLAGECDMALAGGVSISVPQRVGYLYEEGLLVSPDGHCRAFDAAARGTVFGNGAGLVVLKRLDEALTDGDRVYAVVKGSAVNNDGGEKVGYFAPSQAGQGAVAAEALAFAGVDAETISCVEAHGTATELGDPVEVAGLTEAFRAHTDKRQFCALGSVKSNVGHLQIACGVAGFIKTVLALAHKELPPSLHFERPNPRIDFAASPFYVNTRLIPWTEGNTPRRAAVNSLGIGGTNAHVILEEAPAAAAARKPRETRPRTVFRRKRYWVERPAIPVQGDALSRAREDEVHALLGRRLKSPALKDVVFESTLSVERWPPLADHRFFGTPILPGACQLVMALDAAAQLSAEGRCTLENVAFTQLLAVPDGRERTVQLILSGESAAGRSFRLVSTEEDGDGGLRETPWTVHATGRLVAFEPPDALPAVVQPTGRDRFMASSHQELSGAEFYRNMREHEVELGPAFRVIESAWVGDAEVLCRLAIPDGLDHAAAGRLHPAVLDACLQVMGGAYKYPSDTTLVPTAVERFRFLEAPAGDRLWCHVRVREPGGAGPLGPARVTANACLFDEEGRVSALLEGLRYERVPRAVFVQLLGRGPGGAIYRPVWVPKPLAPPAAQRDDAGPGRWLVFDNGLGVGMELARLVAEAGGECVLVEPGSECGQIAPGRYHVAPARPDDFRQLFKSVETGEQRQYDAVVHLGGLRSMRQDDTVDVSLRETDLHLAERDVYCASLLHVVQALAARGAAPPRLCLVTQGAQPVIDDDGKRLGVDQAPLWGLARTIGLEMPQLECRCVDLDPAAGEDQAQRLLEELLHGDEEPEVALRRGERYAARLMRHESGDETARPSLGEGTYLLIGGTGALGLKVAQWLIDEGAKHLALVSRRGAASNEAREALDRWRREGIDVSVLRADVAEAEEAARVVESLASPRGTVPFSLRENRDSPLRGVVHAAGVLDDGTLESLTWRRFERVMAAKVRGAWNLHRLTRDLPLDFFVAFSSIASLLGSPGQGNYAAANAFLDALMHHRRALGLPGLAINWGPWADAGMAAGLDAAARQALERRGLTPLEPAAALGAMSALMAGDVPQAAVLEVDWPRYVRETHGAVPPPRFESLVQPGGGAGAGAHAFRSSLGQAPVEERASRLGAFVSELIGELLGTNGREQVPSDRGFYELGMDSLSVMLLRNRLQQELGVSLPATLAFEHTTVRSLTEFLAREVLPSDVPPETGAGEPNQPPPCQPAEPPADWAAALDDLSEGELAERLAEKLATIKRDHGAT